MVSSTQQFDRIRKRKKTTSGKRNKRDLRRNGTPAFPVHQVGYTATAADSKKTDACRSRFLDDVAPERFGLLKMTTQASGTFTACMVLWTGLAPDADGDVGQFLKKTFSSGRSVAGTGATGPFVPPVALQIDTPHGAYRLAVGRWKWKSQGGYPTLTHGGLSLLEVLSPFVEITK